MFLDCWFISVSSITLLSQMMLFLSCSHIIVRLRIPSVCSGVCCRCLSLTSHEFQPNRLFRHIFKSLKLRASGPAFDEINDVQYYYRCSDPNIEPPSPIFKAASISCRLINPLLFRQFVAPTTVRLCFIKSAGKAVMGPVWPRIFGPVLLFSAIPLACVRIVFSS